MMRLKKQREGKLSLMTFRLLESIDISDGATIRKIALYEGDLTAIPGDHRTDILIVSAFPNDYTPSRTSLIGSLEKRGLSIGQLAAAKAYDLRTTSAFWLSNAITGPAAGMNIGHVACFEPRVLGSPPTVVGNLFRGLFPFFDDRKDQVVMMPVLASGDQAYTPEIMLCSILEAAVHWLARGLAISELKIVERNSVRAAALANMMADFKSKLVHPQLKPLESKTFDVFLSFSILDSKAADIARDALTKQAVARKVFDFRLQIDKGKSWQDEIDSALSSSSAVMAILSPSYFRSPECQEELAQARLRNKKSERTVLFPIYWLDSGKELALWLQILNFADCREGDYRKLTQIVSELALKW